MNIDLVRAWKDEGYRETLSDRQLALVQENPAGAIELTESELTAVDGGMLPLTTLTTTCTTLSIAMSCKYLCL